MIKIGIITINDFVNYGNRLQTLALQMALAKLNVHSESIYNDNFTITKRIILKLKSMIKTIINYDYQLQKNKKYYSFKKFNSKYIIMSKYKILRGIDKNNLDLLYDNFIVGSDQVWNMDFISNSDADLLTFSSSYKKISYSASFGKNVLDENLENYFKKRLIDFKSISVREDSGKKIVEELTGRKDVEVLIDPTMLLTPNEWDKVSKKPKMLKTDKYILNYFLGDLSNERYNEIKRIADENNCEIINLMDKKSPFYTCGPSEFLYLEKYAFLICTDSFHSSVFAILYNRPFVVFNREQEGVEDMSSRIDTLLSKFKLKNRRFTGTITKENLEHDYSEAYKILEKEREKSRIFLENALDIKHDKESVK